MKDHEEHLAWCKQRAMERFNRREYYEAVSTMISDMNQREDCKVNMHLEMLGLQALMRMDVDGIKRFIEGFR